MVKISVIIPGYNVEDYLEECLDSVVNQTFADIEIICINDGSTDNTPNILTGYARKDNRIKIIDQTNHGLSHSRNTALDIAEGEYICFLDADDYLDLTALEKTVEICEEKSLDFLIFKLIDFDDQSGKQTSDDYFDMPFLKRIVKDNVFSIDDVGERLYTMCVTAPGKLYRREFIRDVRFPEGLIFEDNAFFTELMFMAKRIYFLDEYLYFRRVRPSSITNSNTKFSDWIEINNLLIDITKRYGYYTKAKYKRILFNKKIFNSYKFFSAVNEDEKEDFFNKLKADFINHRQEYETDEVFYHLRAREKLIFRTCITAKSYREFELTVQNHDLKNSNAGLEKQNNKMKKEISSYKQNNNEILNSTSWKSTEPIRKVKNIFKSK